MSSSSDDDVCRKERAEAPPSLFQNGNIVFQVHHVGWILTGCFTVIATVISLWLVNKHLQWYTNKREQRYVVRILFLVPLYATISFASYLWWNHATPIILIRDGYESTVLTAFFYLLLMYLSPDPDEQRLIFMRHGLSRQNDAERIKKGEPIQRWVFPLGFIKWKPMDGLYFLQLMKWGVLQYCVLRPVTTFIAVILDYLGLYCESSWRLGWGHIYITIIVSLSVTVAMYCLIQLYIAVSKDLAKHKPLLKLFAIKAVVFLTFWQATFLSILSMFGVVKDTKYMTAEDINIGIGALLETFEMMLFALLHVRAFTFKVYRPFHDPKSDLPPPERTPRLKSLGHAMDFRETFRELWVGCVYMWHKFRGREPVIDTGAVRATHYEGIFGKQRPTQYHRSNGGDDSGGDNINLKQPTLPRLQVGITEHVDVDIGGEKQWLGTGDDYGYGLKFFKRERSEGLKEQIEKELEKRGYTLRNEDNADLRQPKHPRQKSWWRSIYNRISQTGHEEPCPIEEARTINAPMHRSPSRSKTRRRSHSRHLLRDPDASRRLLAAAEPNTAFIDLEDQPPPSLMGRRNGRKLRHSVDKWRKNIEPPAENEDVLMPLPVPAQEYSGHRRASGNVRVQERFPDFLGASVSSVLHPVIDPSPRQQDPLQSPGAEGRLERMFQGVMDHPSAEHNQIPTATARPDTTAESYRLVESTAPIHWIPSQPSAIVTNQSGMADQRHPMQYHLDDDAHVPPTADTVDASMDVPLEHDDGALLSTSPLGTHRRESAIYRVQYSDSDLVAPPIPLQIPSIRRPAPRPSIPLASPSFPKSSAALRRSSVQYYSSKGTTHKRYSLPFTVDVPHPSSVSPPMSPHRRRQPHHTRQGHYPDERSLGLLRHQHALSTLPPTSTSPQKHDFPFPMRSPVSPIDDGLSRYPAHISRAPSTVPRHS